MKIRTVQSKLTHDQLQEYLERISWTSDAPQATLSCLTLLMRKHLTSIPFSNHFIAYQESIPDLDFDKLFDRLVRRRGGFFCFGQNLLFREVLRAIGFRCYSTAARVNSEHGTSEEVSLGALNHMCIFVSLEADREEQEENHLYLVDVGFGALNINAPLRLCEGAQALGAVNEQHRIARIQHPTSSLIPGHAESGLTGLPLGLEFALQYRTLKQDGQPAHPWRTCNAFALTEMSSDDYESFHFSTCRRSPLFSSNVVASVLIDTGDEQQPLGKLTIFNDKMQKRLPAAEPEKTTITTEKERLRILREQFGLGDIPDDAQTTIRNKGFALP